MQDTAVERERAATPQVGSRLREKPPRLDSKPPERHRARRIPSAMALGMLVASLGCSIPLAVHRVTNPASDPRGVQFLVRRPSYRAFLWLQPSSPDARCSFQVVLEQTLDGDPIVYEAVGETNLLAATETTITLDDRGGLSSLAAGESDRAADIAAGVASIAASFAPLGILETGEPPESECPGLPDDMRARLGSYLPDHRKQEMRLSAVRRAIAAKTAGVAESTSSAGVRAIAALRELAAELEAELAAHRFELEPAYFEVRHASGPPAPPRSDSAGTPGMASRAAPDRAEGVPRDAADKTDNDSGKTASGPWFRFLLHLEGPS